MVSATALLNHGSEVRQNPEAQKRCYAKFVPYFQSLLSSRVSWHPLLFTPHPPRFNRLFTRCLQKTQTVKVSLRNDSRSPMQLKVGEQVMSIDAGKTVAVKVPVGTRIVVNAATSTHQAGELIAEATPALDNSTVAIK